jgi:hypothetical protein
VEYLVTKYSHTNHFLHSIKILQINYDIQFSKNTLATGAYGNNDQKEMGRILISQTYFLNSGNNLNIYNISVGS